MTSVRPVRVWFHAVIDPPATGVWCWACLAPSGVAVTSTLYAISELGVTVVRVGSVGWCGDCRRPVGMSHPDGSIGP